jgi:hypothetical protein
LTRLTLLLSLFFAALPSAAAAQSSTEIRVSSSASVLKPLVLETLRNLDFGTIILGAVTSNQTVSVTPTGRSCGTAGGGMTCSGTFSTALFRATGSNRQVVLITVNSPATLTNANGNQLALTLSAPRSVTMPNSGNSGVEFEVSGSLTVSATVPDGFYSGTFHVEIAYQ